jgi:anhydro-N-acetylmuramic acid kinase
MKVKAKAMIVAGVMSGTSVDGVDVALCRIAPGKNAGDSPRVKLLGWAGAPYPKAVRAAVLRVMEGAAVTAAEMSRLNWRLGEIYAQAVENASQTLNVKVDLVGCHGQTVYHQAVAEKYLGVPVRCTWQLGEAAVLTERLKCPVVSDFRPADIAAGGQGAPLVPMLDWYMFRSPKVNRVLQNLGGIGNLTALPAGCRVDGVMAFDTGPGNMVIDYCMSMLYGRKFDRNGTVARRGRVLREVVAQVMRNGYFSAQPPKSCGREEFGAAFATGFIAMCRKAGASHADIVATATALTVESVLDAYRRFVVPHFRGSNPKRVEFCVAGGGAKNATLMGMLQQRLAELGVRVKLIETLGIPAQAKESVAFALLAWLTWCGLPGDVPAATGARRAVVLGKVSLP